MSRRVKVVGNKKTVNPLKRVRDDRDDEAEQGRVSKRDRHHYGSPDIYGDDSYDPRSPLASPNYSSNDEDDNSYDPGNSPTLSDLPSYNGTFNWPRSPVRPSYSDEEEEEGEESKREMSDSSFEAVYDWRSSPVRPSYSDEEFDDDDDDLYSKGFFLFSLSLSLSFINKRKESITFEDAFFFESGHVPFLYKPGDKFILDPNVRAKGDRMVLIMDDRNERRNLFSRDLRSHENGTLVSKHCAPWGDMNILHNNVFKILSRVFSSGGEVSFIHLREVGEKREFFIEPAFFAGWLDLNDDVYEKFCRSKLL